MGVYTKNNAVALVDMGTEVFNLYIGVYGLFIDVDDEELTMSA